jgi:hypothetical protein
MAITMTVRPLTKAGVSDLAADAYVQLGNAAGGAGGEFLFPNDGKTFLYVDGVTGDTFTFTAVADKYGRTETLAVTVAAGKNGAYGPFLPELWNNAAGCVRFIVTAGNVGDLLLAVRVANPT